MERKFKVGVIGATGYVGQRFVTLLDQHPWFICAKVAASPRSAGQSYEQAVSGRWKIDREIPDMIKKLIVYSSLDLEAFCDGLDFVFCAVDMPKDQLRKFEEDIARLEVPVVSNNSAHRGTVDVPMIIPEVNPSHAAIIDAQRRRLGTQRGFIAVKPNCSIQSYVPALAPLYHFGIDKVSVCTYQAISGAGKTFEDWPEMIGNLIPYIGGEEEKSEKEPLKIWGNIVGDAIEPVNSPVISAQCYRVAVQEGHTAAVSVSFKNKPTIEQMKEAWASYQGEEIAHGLPSSPEHFLQYFEEDNRPQAALDANLGGGMSISIGRLREDNIFDYKFTCLSHNTLRGAAGGAVLTAELLVKLGYITYR